MTKLLKDDEIIALLEEQSGKVWNFATVARGGKIENTDFFEILIYVTRDQSDVIWIKELLADVLNVIEVKYTGIPRAGL